MTDLRTLERDSIRAFVESCAEHFTGHVLDLGAGKMPYRDVVETAGGTYVSYDRVDYPGSVVTEPRQHNEDAWPDGVRQYDTILCTQVVQYVPRPDRTIAKCHESINEGGVLVLTGPTNWPEVEEADLHRFTRAGILRLLVDAGFVVERLERRAEFVWQGETFALGYGVVARA